MAIPISPEITIYPLHIYTGAQNMDIITYAAKYFTKDHYYFFASKSQELPKGVEAGRVLAQSAGKKPKVHGYAQTLEQRFMLAVHGIATQSPTTRALQQAEEEKEWTKEFRKNKYMNSALD